MALNLSALSDLLDAWCAGGDLDVIREGLALVLLALIDAEAAQPLRSWEPGQRRSLGALAIWHSRRSHRLRVPRVGTRLAGGNPSSVRAVMVIPEHSTVARLREYPAGIGRSGQGWDNETVLA